MTTPIPDWRKLAAIPWSAQTAQVCAALGHTEIPPEGRSRQFHSDLHDLAVTTHFAQINSNGGYIGRLSWWNTMDTQAINPHCPVNIRLWGKGPFLLKGWGSAK